MKLLDDVGDCPTDARDFLKPLFADRLIERHGEHAKIIRRARIGARTVGISTAQPWPS